MLLATSREEGIELLDRQARKYLGMSGVEFVQRYRAGQIDEPNRLEVVRVAMLIPFADEWVVAGQSPNDAFAAYIEPLRSVLGCITRAQFILRERERLEANRLYPVALNSGDPVLLRGHAPITLSVAQNVRIVRAESPTDPREPYVIETVAYVYGFTTRGRAEILTFQWTPEAAGEGAVTFPHLHVGPAISASQTAIRLQEFHKVHVPTGQIALVAMIRLAIT
jgi:hypothetical protein